MSMLPFHDRDGVIWFNGDLVPWRDAKVHVLTHGLHYASCVFEGERVYGGEIFELTQHTERLHHSAEVLGFSLPWSVAEIDEACRQVIREMNIVDGYVRPVAWRGSEMMGVSAQTNKINVAIAAWEWPAYFTPEARLEGIRKAAGLYMICTLSKHEVEGRGYNDALMLDWRGQIAEATGANIFLVQNGVIHTPTPDCFLDGITRRTVIDLARARGYEVVERAIMPEELGHTDEVFLTGTAVEVTPVREIGQYNFQVGDITRNMVHDYDSLVQRADNRAASARASAA
jgi:branched-chain amino acid aminotransferase